MLSKEQLLKKMEENYPYFSNEFGVQRIGLFGSYVKDTQNEDSDIDIVVEFERPIGLKFVKFVEYLESLFGKHADVLTLAGIKGIRNPDISKSILETLEYV